MERKCSLLSIHVYNIAAFGMTGNFFWRVKLKMDIHHESCFLTSCRKCQVTISFLKTENVGAAFFLVLEPILKKPLKSPTFIFPFTCRITIIVWYCKLSILFSILALACLLHVISYPRLYIFQQLTISLMCQLQGLQLNQSYKTSLCISISNFSFF